MPRIFMDEWGRYYKADAPKSEHDAEKVTPPADWLSVLPDDGKAINEVELSKKLNGIR